jgi:hypothetical protein
MPLVNGLTELVGVVRESHVGLRKNKAQRLGVAPFAGLRWGANDHVRGNLSDKHRGTVVATRFFGIIAAMRDGAKYRPPAAARGRRDKYRRNLKGRHVEGVRVAPWGEPLRAQSVDFGVKVLILLTQISYFFLTFTLQLQEATLELPYLLSGGLRLPLGGLEPSHHVLELRSCSCTTS